MSSKQETYVYVNVSGDWVYKQVASKTYYFFLYKELPP